MILRTIHCSVKGCPACKVEEGPNRGWPGWGHVVGLFDDQTGDQTAHLCPAHMEAIKKLLNGELK